MQNERPDPDQLLAKVQAQEAAAHRGHLRIYFGASAGVGKTYAMLAAARALRNEGKDVVVGVVETHGRKETEALLQGIEVLPLARNRAPGHASCTEFDLDAALRRRPALILVDELAHTNVEGSRHPEAMAGHRRAAGERHRRLHDAQRPAPREPERRRRRHHRHHGLGNRSRHVLRQCRRGDAGRHSRRRSARPPQGRQGVRSRAGRARGAQLLPQGQPDGAARACAAPHRGPRRGRRPGLSLGPGDRAGLEDGGVAPLLRRAAPRKRLPRAERGAPRDAARRRVDRRLRRDADLAAARRAGTRAHPAHGQARPGARCEDGDSVGRGPRGARRRLRAHAQLLEDRHRTRRGEARLAVGADPGTARGRSRPRHRPDRDRPRRSGGPRPASGEHADG